MGIKKEKKAEALYKKILHDVELEIGSDSTYAVELDKIGRRYLGIKFRGVFPSDKIPRLNDLTPYCILNLDRSGEPGSHWVALAKVENTRKSIIYDSFGRSHAKIIPSLHYSGNGRIVNSDQDSEQGVLQQNCGARSVAFLILFDRHGFDVAKLI